MHLVWFSLVQNAHSAYPGLAQVRMENSKEKSINVINITTYAALSFSIGGGPV